MAKRKPSQSATSGRQASGKRTKSVRRDAQGSGVQKRAGQVLRRLAADYGDAECALLHCSPFELLIATILSAQCTDARVNLVTRDLFKRYPAPADFAAAPIRSIEKAIRSTGFFRNKAKNIKACCTQLEEKHDGEVPRDLDALVELPGVGRKTANVVLGTAFAIPSGVVVDTHVGRLSRRLGLTTEKDAVKVERDLMEILPDREWINFSHRMIHHGRRVCQSRRPACDDCSMLKFCPQVGV
ncbi:endonuclease III [Pirellulales bacterium]|nr:endonuclease III [Pirellulales bacterium]